MENARRALGILLAEAASGKIKKEYRKVNYVEQTDDGRFWKFKSPVLYRRTIRLLKTGFTESGTHYKLSSDHAKDVVERFLRTPRSDICAGYGQDDPNCLQCVGSF